MRSLWYCICLFCCLHSAAQSDIIPIRDCVKDTYTAEIGVREEGSNRGERVEMYLASAGFGGGYAWCVAFVGWVLQQHCLPIPSSPAWSPAWFPQDRIICRSGNCTTQPQHGDVIGIYFQSKGRIAHGGFYDHEDGDYVITVEGNTNEAGSREGDGVYKKRRPKMTIYYISNWIDQ